MANIHIWQMFGKHSTYQNSSDTYCCTVCITFPVVSFRFFKKLPAPPLRDENKPPPAWAVGCALCWDLDWWCCDCCDAWLNGKDRDGGWEGLLGGSGWVSGVEGGLTGGGRGGRWCEASEEFILLSAAGGGSITVWTVMQTKWTQWAPSINASLYDVPH